MVWKESTINTINHEKIKITIVLIAVAKCESIFLIPIFARIAVIPAKNADPKAYIIHMDNPSLSIVIIMCGRYKENTFYKMQ